MKIYVELNSKTNKIVDLYESLKDIMTVHSEDKYVYFALANAVYHKSNYKGYKYICVDTSKSLDDYDRKLKPIYSELVNELKRLRSEYIED